jgi:hypothetical protein
MDRVEKITSFFELVVAVGGLRSLTGEKPPLSIDYLVDAVESLKETPERLPVQIPRGTVNRAETRMFIMDRIEEALDLCGGWERIVEATQTIKEIDPARWKIFVDHLAWVSRHVGRLSCMTPLEVLAKRHGVSPNTVMRARQRIPEQIAHACMVLGA